MSLIFHSIINSLAAFIDKIGYLGIFIGMFLESTIFPLPSEVIMIPAGIAASENIINIYFAIICGVLGNFFGAVFSYFIAMKIGRSALFRFGKYFFLSQESAIKIESFFKNHGEISVFIGRLVLGLRHFISLFAGVAKMNIKLFCLYTLAGSALWNIALTIFGYAIGRNQEAIKEYSATIALGAVAVSLIVIGFYIFFKPTRR